MEGKGASTLTTAERDDAITDLIVALLIAVSKSGKESSAITRSNAFENVRAVSESKRLPSPSLTMVVYV